MSTPGHWRLRYWSSDPAPSWKFKYFSSEQDANIFRGQQCWDKNFSFGLEPEFVTVIDMIRES